MNSQTEIPQNLTIPIPLCISDSGTWLTLWKAELEFVSALQVPKLLGTNPLSPTPPERT